MGYLPIPPILQIDLSLPAFEGISPGPLQGPRLQPRPQEPKPVIDSNAQHEPRRRTRQRGHSIRQEHEIEAFTLLEDGDRTVHGTPSTYLAAK